jgi:hypothetical protein
MPTVLHELDASEAIITRASALCRERGCRVGRRRARCLQGRDVSAWWPQLLARMSLPHLRDRFRRQGQTDVGESLQTQARLTNFVLAQSYEQRLVRDRHPRYSSRSCLRGENPVSSMLPSRPLSYLVVLVDTDHAPAPHLRRVSCDVLHVRDQLATIRLRCSFSICSTNRGGTESDELSLVTGHDVPRKQFTVARQMPLHGLRRRV